MYLLKNNMPNIIPFHSPRGCLSYLVADPASREALLIDPSEEVPTEQYLERISKEGYKLLYILETHTHADHISSANEIRASTGAIIARHYKAPSSQKDRALHGEDVLALGETNVSIIETPGHTDESISISVPGAIFTGDVLLIGTTGRTDFQLGSSSDEYKSLWEKILSLPDDTVVYPAHDYQGRTHTTIKDERLQNPRLKLTREEFVATMDEQHPPLPDLFKEAIAKNSL